MESDWLRVIDNLSLNKTFDFRKKFVQPSVVTSIRNKENLNPLLQTKSCECNTSWTPKTEVRR